MHRGRSSCTLEVAVGKGTSIAALLEALSREVGGEVALRHGRITAEGAHLKLEIQVSRSAFEASLLALEDLGSTVKSWSFDRSARAVQRSARGQTAAGRTLQSPVLQKSRLAVRAR